MAETTGKNNASNISANDNPKVESETTGESVNNLSKQADNNEKVEVSAVKATELHEENANNNSNPEELAATEEAEEDLNKQVSELQSQVHEISNKYLRALAEMENNKKRAEKALQDTRIFAITNLAKELIVILDIFDKAFVGLQVETITDNNLKNFAIGMQLTQKELLKTLDKFGIQKIYPVNEKFNPNLHEALFSKADEKQENGMIFEVVESGYLLQERLLRPAKVGIIKNEKA